MIITNSKRRLPILAFAIAALLILYTPAFSQNASLSGTVQDASQGYLPGVTVTATNVSTGVESTTLSNDSGAFTFPSLQPGTYTVSAELDGFQKSTKTEVALGGGAQSRLNFELQVAGLSEELEVTTTAQDILTESSSSTGTVLEAQQVVDLPLTSNDVMELVNIMGGVQPSQLENFGSEFDSNRTDQSFAGVSANQIRIEQDGITINDVRYNTGIASSSRINTEMVSEFKLILSPVDAEMGRGMGQVQILTKSGANQFHGSGVWNITNTALDANSWNNNRQDIPLDYRNLNNYMLTFSGPIKKNKTFFFVTWDHAIPRTHTNLRPQVMTNCARKGIFRYFTGWTSGHYDTIINHNGNAPVRANVDLNGFPLDQDLADAMGYTFVGLDEGDGPDAQGRPTGHYVMPDMGPMQYLNVFGPLSDAALAQVAADPINCSQFTPDYANYDMSNPSTAQSLSAAGISRYWEEGTNGGGTVYRLLDTRAIPNFTNVVPLANSFQDNPTSQGQAMADGLNFAVHRWTRADKGVDRIYGVGQENSRKNITVKLDHNFNDRHRVSGTYTYERDVNTGATKLWPNGYQGTTERFPQRTSVTFTSSLRPTLLNEARFGLNRNLAHSLNAIDATETKQEVHDLMASMLDTSNWQNYPQGEPMYFNPQRFWTNNYMSHFIGGNQQSWVWHSYLPSWGGFDHRWTIGDTLTWTKGRHSLKFGGEILLTRSHQDADGDAGLLLSRPSMPIAFGGVSRYSLPTDMDPSPGGGAAPQIPGLTGDLSFLEFAGTYLNITNGSVRQLTDMRDYMAGSMSHIWQWFFINDPFSGEWNDINKGETTRISDIRHKEMSFFAKDDWKVNNSLTLNLGLRYEYYGVPHMDRGLTLGLIAGPGALFGVSGRDFNGWMPVNPVNLDDTRSQEEIDNGITWLTQQQFVGPGSPNPDLMPFSKDLNNIGPAIGFAYQLPWFGKGKTTVRGGYQLSYSQIANAASTGGGFADILAGSTGTNFDFYYYGGEDQPYMRFADIDSYLPTKKYLDQEADPILPLQTLDIKNREQPLSVYDYDIVNPYTQSLNFSVSRTLSSTVTLDVRYIGTLGRKGISNLNLNTANWINNSGLIEAFDAARRGETHPILDKMFEGVQFNLNGGIAVGQPGGPTGGDVLRGGAAGAGTGILNALAEGDYNTVAASISNLNYPRTPGGWDWTCWCFLPRLNMDLPAKGTLEDGTVLRHANTLYPGEFPENYIVANPQLSQANWYANLDHNNYHSMQVMMTVRPTHGFNMTATYTWAKNLGTGSYTNPNDRANSYDYTYTGNSRAHQLNTYGTWTLPFGANGFFFRDVSNPVVRRLIEGWNLGWILSLNSGSRSNITSSSGHWFQQNSSMPHAVQPDLFDSKGHVVWENGSRFGTYFGDLDQYMYGPDLQCFDRSLVSSSLQSTCETQMSAMYIPMYEENPDTGEMEPVYSEENVIFKNTLPAEYGTFGRNTIENIGSWSLDMNMGKTVELTEGKSIGFRVDAGNIFNHPSPVGPTTSIDKSNNGLGYIGFKSGQRRFQAKITLRF